MLAVVIYFAFSKMPYNFTNCFFKKNWFSRLICTIQYTSCACVIQYCPPNAILWFLKKQDSSLLDRVCLLFLNSSSSIVYLLDQPLSSVCINHSHSVIFPYQNSTAQDQRWVQLWQHTNQWDTTQLWWAATPGNGTVSTWAGRGRTPAETRGRRASAYHTAVTYGEVTGIWASENQGTGEHLQLQSTENCNSLLSIFRTSSSSSLFKAQGSYRPTVTEISLCPLFTCLQSQTTQLLNSVIRLM